MAGYVNAKSTPALSEEIMTTECALTVDFIRKEGEFVDNTDIGSYFVEYLEYYINDLYKNTNKLYVHMGEADEVR